jgi:hypothetical protein
VEKAEEKLLQLEADARAKRAAKADEMYDDDEQQHFVIPIATKVELSGPTTSKAVFIFKSMRRDFSLTLSGHGFTIQ